MTLFHCLCSETDFFDVHRNVREPKGVNKYLRWSLESLNRSVDSVSHLPDLSTWRRISPCQADGSFIYGRLSAIQEDLDSCRAARPVWGGGHRCGLMSDRKDTLFEKSRNEITALCVTDLPRSIKSQGSILIYWHWQLLKCGLRFNYLIYIIKVIKVKW